MNKIPLGKTQLYQFTIWQQHPTLVHALTSAQGNFDLSLRHNSEQARNNRQQLCQFLDIPPQNLIVPTQNHSNSSAIVTPTDKGRGATDHQSAFPKVDALITEYPNVPLLALSADCPVIGIFEPKRHLIAVIHAGWRGTLNEIVKKTAKRMIKELQADPEQITACLAPCIGPESYEVGEEVVERARELSYGEECLIKKERGIHLDLWKANLIQLQSLGINQIEHAQICTYQDENFFSHRRQQGKAGRFGLVMMMRE